MFNLFTRDATNNQPKDEVIQLPIGKVTPNRYQPRTIFNDEKIVELSDSIREHGIIQPIVVRKYNDLYEIIAGERRYRASKLIGLEKIPVIVRDLDDKQSASIAIIENIQREDLTAIEEAVAYRKLMDLHGITQAVLAKQMGKSQSTVANKIRLLNLAQEVQDAVRERKITERHARSLLVIKEKKLQLELLEKIIEKDLKVSETETLIEQILNPEVPEKMEKATTTSKIPRDARIAMNTFKQAVMMVEKTGMKVKHETEEREDAFVITISLPKMKTK
ncbi:MAG: nucleoid occlusion protein [Turicibacter sp.]|nr:nucleoid occlusion protein [Turicibacter sp.]